MAEAQRETKEFWKTSEFALTMFVNLATFVAMALGRVSFEVALGVWTGANGLYAVSRGVAKSGVPPTPPGSRS